ncbi:MAG: hypothetical protein U0840_13855 [Gemmataceae bacterium]
MVTSVLLLAWPYLVRPEPARTEGGSLVTIEEATQALASGQYNLARAQFKALLEARTPTDLPASVLHHLFRQTDLLARLAPRSLEEIVRHAALVRHPDEWASQFADYRQRSIILDDALRRDDRGRPMLAHYVLAEGDMPVRLALEELTLLRDLPLDDAPRVIFGARLAECSREEGGTWVIHLVPDSGVLLTEPAALESCYLQPLDEPTRAVLERQKRWRSLEQR